MTVSLDMSSLTDAERVLVDLVATPSVSGAEHAAARVFVRHARALGFETELDEADNAIAHRGAPEAEAATHIVLLGHIDTVPGDIPVRIEDGVLFGRGSVDAKGPLAAMLVAASRADLPSGVRITVAGAAGEETAGSPGARHLVNQWRPDACIIGEPSGWDGVTLGYKGRLLATATAQRSNAHSAGRDQSAGDDVFAWWSAVLELVAAHNGASPRAFDTIQARIQNLGFSDNGLSHTATLEAGFRLPVGVEPACLARRIESLAGEHVAVECSGFESAHQTDRNDPAVRALSASIRAAGGRPRPKLKTGTADFNVVGPIWNCPIAAYGPGDSALDHTPDERLSLDEFARSIDVLTPAIEALAVELSEPKVAPTVSV